MDTHSAKRILLIGKREAGALNVIKGDEFAAYSVYDIMADSGPDLTGSAPTPDEGGCTAGLTHEWRAETAYYKAIVPIWVDEFSDARAWAAEFMAPEAREVVDAVGAWIYVYSKAAGGVINDEAQGAMESIQSIVHRHLEDGPEPIMLAVARPQTTGGSLETSSGDASQVQEQCEDICSQFGFEYIDYGAKGQNEYGEKVGFERLKEALETNEWPAVGDDAGGADSLLVDEADESSWGGIDLEEAEWTSELFGVKAALQEEGDRTPDQDESTHPEDQADQVDGLDKLLSKLMAVKEQSAGLPEADRKRIAAQAVRDVMQQI